MLATILCKHVRPRPEEDEVLTAIGMLTDDIAKARSAGVFG